ncbi:hypothetical protein BC833DRAFT_584281 [Globomyces pollinis-pini]|nr:hypothetical protein BC833DRAFT_584281 [Globomyces pollinis-pini]
MWIGTASIGLMTITTVFFDWIPTKLNRNIETMTVKERLPSTVIHGSLGLFFSIVHALNWKWVVFVGSIWYSFILVMAVINWWIPYFFGIHYGEITVEDYDNHYANNLIILPRIGNNPIVPDVQHTLIHLTVLIAVVCSWITFVIL